MGVCLAQWEGLKSNLETHGCERVDRRADCGRGIGFSALGYPAQRSRNLTVGGDGKVGPADTGQTADWIAVLLNETIGESENQKNKRKNYGQIWQIEGGEGVWGFLSRRTFRGARGRLVSVRKAKKRPLVAIMSTQLRLFG